jgi:pimeloyl-ACP methyl ester carboxylesterase
MHTIFTTASTSHMLTGAELRRLKPPTMLIWGAHERILPPESLAFFRKHLPRGVEIRDQVRPCFMHCAIAARNRTTKQGMHGMHESAA